MHIIQSQVTLVRKWSCAIMKKGLLVFVNPTQIIFYRNSQRLTLSEAVPYKCARRPGCPGNSRLMVRADHHMYFLRSPRRTHCIALPRDCVSCHSVYFQLVVTGCAEQTNELALVTHNLSKHWCPKVSRSWECNIKCVLFHFPLMDSSHRKCISLQLLLFTKKGNIKRRRD